MIQSQQLKQVLGSTLRFTEVASFALKRACDELTIQRQRIKEAEEVNKGMVDHLVKSGAVREDERSAAEKMLSTHAGTLTLLKSAVDEIVVARTAKVAGLGHGEDDPTIKKGSDEGSSYNSLTDGYVGRRTGAGVLKESDRAMMRIMEDPR